MTPSEAFVETLVAQGVTDVFGIVGSAYMDALDPSRALVSASSRWRTSRALATWPMVTRAFRTTRRLHRAKWPRHNQLRHCDCGGLLGALAGGGHHPETGSMTLGLGGFQETEQLPIFSKITKFQSHVNNKLRMAELTARAFDRAHIGWGRPS